MSMLPGDIEDHREDVEVRRIFVEAYDLVEGFLTADGSWISLAHEMLAHDALATRFPDLDGEKLFAVLGHIANVRSSGRRPV